MVAFLTTLNPALSATLAAILADDPVPADDDVVAGGWGAVMFIALILGTAVIAWSLTKHLRKVDEAKDAGVFDDPA